MESKVSAGSSKWHNISEESPGDPKGGWVSGGFQRQWDGEENHWRPQSLEDFLGQPEFVANLKVFISAAKSRQEALDHVLFSGPPGLGKTTLSYLVGKELGVPHRVTSGPHLKKISDLAGILTSLEPKEVLFIDEIHRLNIQVEEMLYTAMEDFKLDILIGQGPGARSVRVDLNPFTLVGATTRLGLMSSPLRDRFGITGHLAFYPPSDLVKILTRGAKKLGCSLEKEGMEEVAKRCRGTPRIALRLLKRVHDFLSVEGQPGTHAVVCKALERLGIDAYGLDHLDRRYISFLKDQGSRGVGLETLAGVLSESPRTLEEVTEPYLIQQGWVLKTAQGRQLTAEGLQKARGI